MDGPAREKRQAAAAEAIRADTVRLWESFAAWMRSEFAVLLREQARRDWDRARAHEAAGQTMEAVAAARAEAAIYEKLMTGDYYTHAYHGERERIRHAHQNEADLEDLLHQAAGSPGAVRRVARKPV